MARTKKEKKKKIPDSNKMTPPGKMLDDQVMNSVFLLFAIIGAGLFVRIIALINLNTTIYTDFLLWDERIYHTWAQAIADGSFQSKSVYEFSPLPVYIMAGIYWLFSPDVFYIRILNIVCGTLACWLVYLIAKELISRKVAIIACIIACLYKPFIFYSIVPLKDSLGLLIFAWMSYLLIKVIRDDRYSEQSSITDIKSKILTICLLGLAAGLLLNVRPNAIVLIPVIILLVLWYGYRDKLSWKNLSLFAALYVLGLSVAVAPFVIRNYVVADKIALTTSQSGFNLFLANNIDNPDPYYRPVSFASSSPFEQGIQFTIEASRRAGKKLTSQEASDYWTAQTLKQAAAHPSAFIGKISRKILVVFNNFEACDHYNIDFISNYAKFFKIPFLNFWIIFPLFALGVILNWKDKGTKALFAVWFLYAATLVIFYTNGRYRLLMLVVMIPFAASGLLRLYSDLKEKAYGLFSKHAAVCAACLVVAFLPVRATDDVTAYYNTHAIILASKGYVNEAMLFWKQSSEMNKPFSAFANVSLADCYFRKGLIEEGNAYLARIPDDSFAAAQKYQKMGDVLSYQKNREAAIAAYEKSISINSGQRLPRQRLIDLYKIGDPQKAQNELQALKYIESFYDLM